MPELTQMSEGTPINAIESGDVPNAADAAIMKSILNEMNASGAEVNDETQPLQNHPTQHQQPPPQFTNMPPQFRDIPPQMSQMGLPPMPGAVPYHMPPTFQPMNMAMEKRNKKKNIWSQILERIQDPIVVTILIFLLSLPAFHTVAGKYASWAFAVGGQLSWLGLFALSVLGGLLFSVYKGVVGFLG